MCSYSTLNPTTGKPLGNRRLRSLQILVDKVNGRGYPLTDMKAMQASMGALSPWTVEEIKKRVSVQVDTGSIGMQYISTCWTKSDFIR